MSNRITGAALASIVLFAAATAVGARTAVGVATIPPEREWRVYGGDLASRRYSPLDQIDRGNVHRVATLVPAVRAARISPTEALRSD